MRFKRTDSVQEMIGDLCEKLTEPHPEQFGLEFEGVWLHQAVTVTKQNVPIGSFLKLKKLFNMDTDLNTDSYSFLRDCILSGRLTVGLNDAFRLAANQCFVECGHYGAHIMFDPCHSLPPVVLRDAAVFRECETKPSEAVAAFLLCWGRRNASVLGMLPRDVANMIARKLHCMVRDDVLKGKIVLEWKLLSGYSVESAQSGYCAIIANSCNMSALEGKESNS